MKKILFPFLLLSACTPNNAPLEKEQMALVLFDLHVAEARASMLLNDSAFIADTSAPVESRRQDTLALYHRRILARHNLTWNELSEAFEWYTAHPEALDSAYKKTLLLASDTVGKAP